MKPFVYILTEGVLDIVVLTSVLTRSFEFALLKQKSTLPECFAGWLDAFKWPTGDDITRRAVPAPVFLESDRLLVGIRSAQGIDNMSRTLSIDREVFSRRERQQPVVIGIVLDADDEEPQKRLKSSQSWSSRLASLSRCHWIRSSTAAVSGQVSLLSPVVDFRGPSKIRCCRSHNVGFRSCTSSFRRTWRNGAKPPWRTNPKTTPSFVSRAAH